MKHNRSLLKSILDFTEHKQLYKATMKKLTLTIIFTALLLFAGTYFIGETLQKELPKQLARQHSQYIKTELISYQKSFLSAHAELKMTLPIEGKPPLEFLVNADISHYPYKATSVNHITLIDSATAQQVEAFFNHKDFITSQAEMNLLGHLTVDAQLIKGAFESSHEQLQTQPLNIVYEYDLISNESEFNVDWAGFEGSTPQGDFAANDLNLHYSFTPVKNVPVINYQYHSDINSLHFTLPNKTLALQGLLLTGSNQVSDDHLTVNTKNDWQVQQYRDGEQLFSDNHINLHLSNLNLQALTARSNDKKAPQQLLSDLLLQGATVDLQKLYSQTPWGKVDGELKMDIQPGMVLNRVVENPFLLIDYVNGYLNLSLPQQLSTLPALAEPLKMGTLSGVLTPEGDQLTVQSTLDRGELTINNRVIPM